ncbi:FG-GAP repeat domain-containing protein [Pseudacidobacterium ailaaui]|uniref:FG-GAP repeat domain-containing protein n=1 Tax=Pseudacidobacterium ailaaui TaxID=1382359 RepID=UPI000AB2162E|nr:VCBS repeat-containing protein [Pseudacidobacterium ailaaui]
MKPNLTVVFTLLVLSTSAHSQLAQPRFVSPISWPIGTSAVSMVYDLDAGDIDGDGRPDLVVGLDFEQETPPPFLKWFKGNGDGTFTEMSIPNALTNNVPTSVRLADVNHDGHLDIIAASSDFGIPGNDPPGTELDVYQGNGDGTFKDPQRYLLNVAVYSILPADLENNQKPDIIAIVPGGVEILRNNGNGTFISGQVVAGSYYTIYGAADMNGDHKLDLIVQSHSGIQLLWGNGDGTVKVGPSILPPAYDSLSSSTRAVGIADVNHDGRPDLILSQATRVSVLLNRGDGTFSDANSQKPLRYVEQNGYGDFAVVLGDFNHDGNVDFVVGPYVYEGHGNGVFTIAKVLSGYGNEIGADVNGDRNTDLIWSKDTEFGGTYLSVALGTPTGLFQMPMETVAQGNLNAQPLASGDFNGDGIMDAATPCNLSLCVFLGSGKGYFLAPVVLSAPGTFYGLIAGDVNGDGKLDLVAIANSRSYDVVVYLGNGDGTFRAPMMQKVLNLSNALQSYTAYLTDMNQDGKLDLVGQWGIALGDGDGTFQITNPLPSNIMFLDGITVSDFNRDGFPDVAYIGVPLSDVNNVQIHVLLGDGKGGFSKDIPYSAPNIFGDVNAADVNHDGIPDLIYGIYQLSQSPYFAGIGVALGKGDGTFGPPANFTCSVQYVGSADAVLTGDFNRDGNIDVLFTEFGHVQYFQGNGDGTFNNAEEYFVSGSSPIPIYSRNQYGIFDINGDGFPDIAITDTYMGLIRALNTGK